MTNRRAFKCFMGASAVVLLFAMVTGCPSTGGGGGGGGNGDPVCGDGTVDNGEQCDDGNTVSGDGCDENCRDETVAPACGDGTVDAGEQCDDGNTVSGDGCDENCQNEGGTPVCGDGTLDAGEQCDDGNTASGDGCDENCRDETVAPACGDGTVDAGEQCDDGNTVSGDGCDDNCRIELPSTLFVVNNGSGITSYGNATAANGDVTANTSLPVGSATQVFQPRAIVVTPDDDLIISSQNDAIVVYDDAFTATGALVVDRVIEGSNTLLDLPISFAYDATSDSLYVGNAPAGDGLLVFDNVSSSDFDGDVAPSRRFGPGDRVPFGTDTSESPSYEALAFDTLGNLYAADQSGQNVNFSRILVYANPDTAENLAEPVRTITGAEVDGERPWGQIEDIAIDGNNTMYIVDSDENVVVLDNVDGLDGEVVPDRMISLQVNLADLQGVSVGSDGIGYLADTGNHAIHVLDDIATQDGNVFPNRTIEGNNTDLRTPRDMFLFEP